MRELPEVLKELSAGTPKTKVFKKMIELILLNIKTSDLITFFLLLNIDRMFVFYKYIRILN